MSEPTNLGTLRLQSGEAFIRLRFRLWPQQQVFFEQQLVPRIREFLAREGVENPGSRVTLFFRHPEPQPTSTWRFLRRRERQGKALAIGPEPVGPPSPPKPSPVTPPVAPSPPSSGKG
ncbi:MAG: hypothetical protein JJT96_19725 [Opitutales bacterium]|nr:hypothetical protein [Opitutales bacterium]